ncbi:MAG: biotin carboxyl carrier domain-containing protein [Gemmobacter sp.]|jgi:acetyl-CoA carboxylase biotin carboxyl carrier protein|nr:biotin carboxyl carrier domain-containing protein [Gemmobacter sp.]
MTILTVESALPGVIFLSPSPEVPVFKRPGDAVSAGETIALIEVMKSFLPVEAERPGTFLGYEVENEAGVEPGEAICRIEVTP